MNLPFVDLRAQYLTLKPEIDPAIQAVIDETAFIGGKYVDGLEKAYADCYDPFLAVLSEFPAVKATLHYSGCLLEWIEDRHPPSL